VHIDNPIVAICASLELELKLLAVAGVAEVVNVVVVGGVDSPGAKGVLMRHL
jgi:hypothetical protein